MPRIRLSSPERRARAAARKAQWRRQTGVITSYNGERELNEEPLSNCAQLAPEPSPTRSQSDVESPLEDKGHIFNLLRAARLEPEPDSLRLTDETDDIKCALKTSPAEQLLLFLYTLRPVYSSHVSNSHITLRHPPYKLSLKSKNKCSLFYPPCGSQNLLHTKWIIAST
jgi:hypothetical protein